MKNIIQILKLFRKDKISILLGIGSLTVGIAVSLIIGLWYWNEKSYDHYQPDAENTYRIVHSMKIGAQDLTLGADFAPIGKMVKDIAGVKDATRLVPFWEKQLLKRGDQSHFLSHIQAVDPNFFSFFSLNFKQGNVTSFISKPNSIILNEEYANKIFPNENPIGKIVSFYGDREVTGVFRNLPSNTHQSFKALVQIESVPYMKEDTWDNNDSYITYVSLIKNANKTKIENDIKNMSHKAFKPYDRPGDTYFLQPLKDIHLTKGFAAEEQLGMRIFDAKLLNTFLIIGIIILIVGCVNFINLFISSAFLRAKAIGLKKTIGAKRMHIILDFIYETLVYSAISTIIAVIISYFILPYFSKYYIGYNLPFSFTDIRIWTLLLLLNIFISLFSGIIPGLYMSGFKALETLKSKFKSKRIILLQKSLVITQFAASITLLIGVFIVNQQVHFMTQTDLGFNKDQIISFDIPESYVSPINSIMEELKNHPSVKYVCLSNGSSLQWRMGNPVSTPENPENSVVAEIKQVQHDYFNMLGMKIIEGENTLHNVAGQGFGNECLINETTAKVLGFKGSAVGKLIKIGGRAPFTITGVVKNAYTKSLTKGIDPQVYLRLPSVYSSLTLMVKAKDNNIKPVINLLEKQWKATETEYPFEYHFLDKEYESLYKAEQQAGSLAMITMIIAIFLTVSGLWGMAKYSSDMRTKEIGVRKVNGSNISEILILLNSEFVKWISSAFVIAIPIAYFLMNRWLQGFRLHTPMHWWIFALAGAIVLIVSIFTVSWQSWRAATRNPVEALRYE